MRGVIGVCRVQKPSGAGLLNCDKPMRFSDWSLRRTDGETHAETHRFSLRPLNTLLKLKTDRKRDVQNSARQPQCARVLPLSRTVLPMATGGRYECRWSGLRPSASLKFEIPARYARRNVRLRTPSRKSDTERQRLDGALPAGPRDRRDETAGLNCQ